MICNGCLKDLPSHNLCLKCRRELFDKDRVSLDLDFDSPATEWNELLIENISHISISGVQIKYSIKRLSDKLVLTDWGGQYILKPSPIGPFKNLEQAPANEHLTMQIARQVFDINTAACAVVHFKDKRTLAYLTKRFDVKMDGSHYQQEDFAQLAQLNELNAGKNFKYDFSYEEAAELIQQHVATYQAELEQFFKLVLFNYLIGNGDAHLKNFSVYRTEYGDYRLTPAYDLMNTKIHVPLDSDLALTKGLFKDDYETESFKSNAFFAYDDFYEFGIRIGISKKRTTGIIAKFLGSRPKVEGLIKNSFLSEETKELYLSLYKDKLKAIGYSFLKRI